MSATITPTDRAAAHAALEAIGYGGACDLFVAPGKHTKICAAIGQVIADARADERAACVRELRARAAQARSDGWDMVENGLALAAARIELGIDR